MPKLSEKLAKARKKNNLTMSDVARISAKIATDYRGKITQGYVSRLETGKEVNPSYLKIITLSKIYKIKPWNLF